MIQVVGGGGGSGVCVFQFVFDVCFVVFPVCLSVVVFYCLDGLNMEGEGGQDRKMVTFEMVCSAELMEFGSQVRGVDDEVQDVCIACLGGYIGGFVVVDD